ncbi:uncharacterized protein LOC143735206 isoform X2 [Siphateles boraxobius]|uniref:uncharacterized protein LOC143735206 isoform X2 n=1 Tax=Siphateles boraxobius TaxID=180520 RepID=UPI004062F1AE
MNHEIKQFKDTLLVDQQSVSLTIKNITANFSGIYKFNIFSRSLYKTFNVTVYARLPVPVIISNSSHCSSSPCSLACSSVLNVSHVTLSWYKGISLLSSISVSDLSISLSLPLEVEYQDKNTYSCVLNNPISNQTTHLDINTLCHTCSAQGRSVWAIVGICVGVLLLAAVLAAAAVYCYKKSAKAKEEEQTPEEPEEAIPLNSNPVLRDDVVDHPNNDPVLRDDVVDHPNNDPVLRDDVVDHPNNDGEMSNQQRDLPNCQEECDPLQDMFHDGLDQVKKIKVKHGDTVTLNSGVTDVQRDDRLRWKYADSRVSDCTTLFTVIAVCHKRNDRFTVKDGPGGKFKDRLKLDYETGNLTIENMRVKDTGHFKLEITSNTHRLTKTIKVNVRAATHICRDDLNETVLSLIPEEDPNNTSTYTVDPTGTLSNEDEEESGGER